MSVVFDILLALVLAFLIIRGYSKGFFKSVLSLGRLALSIILTVIFGPRVSSWLDTTYVNPPIFKSVHAKLADMAAKASESTGSFFDSLKDAYGGYLDTTALDKEAASAGADLDALVEEYSQTISHSISGVVATIIGYLLLFLVCFILLTVVIWLVGKLKNLPVIKQCDKLLGLILGLVSGFLAVCLLSSLLYAILSATGDMSAYENSHVFKFIYDLNIFKFILDKVI